MAVPASPRVQSSAELNAWDTWADRISWRDYKRSYESRHRPDLVGFRLDGRPVAVEVELAPKSTARLRAILQMHASWRASGRTNGVWYVCGDEGGRDRIKQAAAGARCFSDGGGLVVKLLDTIKAEAIEMRQADRTPVGVRRAAA